jgi:hypothetical protein
MCIEIFIAAIGVSSVFMIQCNKPFITDSSAPMEGEFSKLAFSQGFQS